MDYRVLQNFKVLEGVNQDGLEQIWQRLSDVELERGRNLFEEGFVGHSLYFLVSGSVKISQKLTLLGEEMAAEVRDKTLISLSASDYPIFGEMASLESGKRSATVTSLESCKLKELSRQNFEEMVFTHQALGVPLLLNLSRMISVRLANANQNVLKLTTALSIALS